MGGTAYVRCHTGFSFSISRPVRQLQDRLDHQVINDIIGCNPTAENIARWCQQQVPGCYRVDVQETAGNTATYEVDE